MKRFLESVILSLLLDGVIVGLLIYFSGPWKPQNLDGWLVVFGILMIPLVPVTFGLYSLRSRKLVDYMDIIVKGEIAGFKNLFTQTLKEQGWQIIWRGEMKGKAIKKGAAEIWTATEIDFRLESSAGNWHLKLANKSALKFGKRVEDFDSLVEALVNRFASQGSLIQSRHITAGSLA